MPSRRRLSRRRRSVVNSKSEIWSVRMRLISSGMRAVEAAQAGLDVGDRMPRFAATSAQRERRVDVADDQHDIGRAARSSTASNAVMTRGGLHARGCPSRPRG